MVSKFIIFCTLEKYIFNFPSSLCKREEKLPKIIINEHARDLKCVRNIYSNIILTR